MGPLAIWSPLSNKTGLIPQILALILPVAAGKFLLAASQLCKNHTVGYPLAMSFKSLGRTWDPSLSWTFIMKCSRESNPS